MRTHDDRLNHLFDYQLVVGRKLADVERARGNARVVGMAFQINDFQIYRLEFFLEAL